MKKFLGIVSGILLCFAFTACPGPLTTPNLPEENQVVTLDQKINGTSRVIDLKGETITEDVEIRSAKTVKNADFDGNTITIKASGVKLVNIKNCDLIIDESVGNGEVYVDECEFDNVKVNGGGANSVHFSNTVVRIIEVNKENVRVVLEEKTTVTDSVNVHSTGTKIEVTAETTNSTEPEEKASINCICIGSNVSSVTLSGGDIKEVKVETDYASISNPVITIASADTNIETVVVVDSDNVEVEDVTVNVVITPEVKEENPDYKVESEVVKEITIESVDFDTSKMKTVYAQHEKFDVSGAFAHVVYSNDASADIELEAKNVKLAEEEKKFSSVPADSIDLHVTLSYAGYETETTITVRVYAVENKVEKATNMLLSESPDFDAAMKLYKEAYEQNPCNETALYYALASIASVSVDESVRDILINNFGFKSYPATMNALFSTDWMEEYHKIYHGYIYDIKEAENYSYYVRCDGENFSETYIPGAEYVSVIENVLSEGKIISISKTYYGGTFTPSNTGKYYIDTYNLINRLGYTDEDLAGYTRYEINFIEGSKSDYILDESIVKMPGLIEPEWFKNTEVYKNSVFNSIYSDYYFGFALLAAYVNCNPNGANETIDKVANVFETKFEVAKTLVAEMDNEPIEVPQLFVSALHLDEMFGDSDVYIGKAEANVLVAALDLMKGDIEFIQAHDLSMNLKSLEKNMDLMFNGTGTVLNEKLNVNDEGWLENQYTSINDYRYVFDTVLTSLDLKNIYAARSTVAMAKSKKSINDALSMIIDSYEFLIGEKSYYPTQVREMLSAYGNGIFVIVKNVNDSIANGAKFDVPYVLFSAPTELLQIDSWSFEKDEVIFQIDFKELFKADALKNILAVDESGNYVYSYSVETSYYFYYHNYEEGSSSVNIENKEMFVDVLNMRTLKEDLEKYRKSVLETKAQLLEEYNITDESNCSWYFNEYTYCNVVPAIRTSVVEKVFPGLLKNNFHEGLFVGDCFLAVGINGIGSYGMGPVNNSSNNNN